jgi:xanthine dehydrogenase YagR molybdenum-binding subunit
VQIERVRVELGRADFPVSGGSGSSWGAANTSSAVRRTCEALREKLRASGGRIPAEGLWAESEMQSVFAAGRILNAGTARSQMIGGMTWT